MVWSGCVQVVSQLRGDSDIWLSKLLGSRPRLAGAAAAHTSWTSVDLAEHLLTVIKAPEDQLHLCNSTRDTSLSWPVTERQAVRRQLENEDRAPAAGSKEDEVAQVQGATSKLHDRIAMYDACIQAQDCLVTLDHLPPCVALYNVLTGHSPTCG